MKKKIKMRECKKKYKWEVLPSFFQLLKVQTMFQVEADD